MITERATFRVPMKRGGEMPMTVEYSVDYYNEPDGQGWEIDIDGFYFNDRDQTERSEFVDNSCIDILREKIADSTEQEARENGWRRPAPYPKYYYQL